MQDAKIMFIKIIEIAFVKIEIKSYKNLSFKASEYSNFSPSFKFYFKLKNSVKKNNSFENKTWLDNKSVWYMRMKIVAVKKGSKMRNSIHMRVFSFRIVFSNLYRISIKV